MTGLERFFRGWLRAEFECAAPEQVLNRLSREQIAFWDAQVRDPFHVQLSLLCRDRRKAQEAAAHAQADFTALSMHAGIRDAVLLWRRAGLTAAVALSVFLTLWLQNFVWFVRVSGNQSVPAGEIVSAMETFGVRFGARSKAINSQEMKNKLLGTVEGLQWAAVNCSGGVCNVLVKEREMTPELLDRRLPHDIVALRSGTVTAVSVLEGQALCAVGDTVQAGEVLVSGINEFAVSVQRVHAQAEIYARTWHPIEVQIPSLYQKRTELTAKHVSRWLQIGRIQIKISGNSSNYGVGCDKIRTRYALTLPGGYQLPLSLICETTADWQTAAARLTAKEAADILLAGAQHAVQQSMTAGQILSEEHQITEAPSVFSLQAVYACEEMIAAEREINLFGSEQIYGRTDPECGTG